jgi:hypothetical protein
MISHQLRLSAATTMHFVRNYLRDSVSCLFTNRTPAVLLNLLILLPLLLMLLIMSNQVPQFCAKHKNAIMVNLVSPRCIAEGCNLLASFALPSSKVSIK